MTISRNDDAQDGVDRIEAPEPTIVGPRPEAAPGAPITVPRGMERLLILAGLNEAWKEKTLADPLRAAAEADISLSPSESAILEATSRKTLGQMILTFARTRLPALRGKALTAGAAAAALLATTSCELARNRPAGIRPDEPMPASHANRTVPTPIQWQSSLEMALDQAVASNRAVMVVCPYGAETEFRVPRPPGTLGIRGDVPPPTFLARLCREGNDGVAQAVSAANLIAVNPLNGPDASLNARDAHKAYVGLLEKHGLADAAPLVLFLAPDGTLLGWEDRADERHIVAAIETVPPLMAGWVANLRPPAKPAPQGSRGHTAR